MGSVCLRGPSALGLRPEKNEGRRKGGKEDTGGPRWRGGDG